MQTTGPSSTTNPFASILAAAQQNGVTLPRVAPTLPSLLNSATGLVDVGNTHHSALCKVQSLRAHKDAPSAADVLTQETLCKLLHTANSNNRLIVKGQQEIAARVRALKSKECIPVERQHQPDYLALLRAIFDSGSTLQQLYEDIAWGLNTLEPAASWEDRLQPILAVLASCQAYESCLNQQDQLLARTRGTMVPANTATQ
ncbi:hypothetical protein VOLCADRAFT_90193 [Volvox carteri f. nagariensis]|uniref:Uncharacterized protein n=1 Tax=Volvox carteri f. nagariensis TaxID=3068 RepID=D8TTQ8_VOLCA|nr:uncharacterized protein VOLCADRAFT_90193 [Volvox carteri f. nagariensis]EFJ49238.1 hypothetical protein VOLCADRAFT_90193 [Volvox carteri f. nagariensis]|eukprot:XP_002949686.1 hypothetical protein VOLCADRAFT_90193 [Volvox carteri f. nagariensis]